MSVSKEKMDSINKDFEKLNANLEGLSEEELKEVAASLRGNVLDMAVGVVIGGAFGNIVT